MIVSIESEGSSVHVEQEHIDNEMLLEDVFNLLIEPALLGFGFQKGSILDVCEEYIMENSDEFITVSAAKAAKAKDDEEDEDEAEWAKVCQSNTKLYQSGYDKGYLVGLRETMIKGRGNTE